MRSYLVLGSRAVLGTPPGEELEAGLTPDAEQVLIDSKRLEILPRRFKVVGPFEVHGVEPGGTLTIALPVGQEKALVQSGHLELVANPKPKQSKSPKKGDDKKEIK